MKIIGSSKIDDYKKTVLEDSVLRAINAKPGDSVLFYKKQNDSNVCIYRAEGAQISNETDTPMRNHLRGAFDRLRTILLATAVMSVLSLFVIALNFGSISVAWFAVGLIASILAIAGAVASIYISQSVDPAFDSQELVTVGGPYSQNRLPGSLPTVTSFQEIFISTPYSEQVPPQWMWRSPSMDTRPLRHSSSVPRVSPDTASTRYVSRRTHPSLAV